MKIGIYGDVHLTKRMGALQQQWNDSALRSFQYMYEIFRQHQVDFVVCLGDFFDKSVLEARSVGLVTSVLSVINNSTFPTKFLLGNHEIDSDEHNILEFLSEYENIDPITYYTVEEPFVYVPYSVDLEELFEKSPTWCKDRYVFTHHDIYGSLLASGKVKASFGTDPQKFKEAILVFNGHVHTSSTLRNVINVGSILKSQQGEMSLDSKPYFSVYDTESRSGTDYFNPESLYYLTVSAKDVPSLPLTEKEKFRTVLKVECDTQEETEVDHRGFLQVTMKLSAKSQTLDTGEIITSSHIDLKEYISRYIQRDESIPLEDKSTLLSLGLKLLEGVS